MHQQKQTPTPPVNNAFEKATNVAVDEGKKQQALATFGIEDGKGADSYYGAACQKKYNLFFDYCKKNKLTLTLMRQRVLAEIIVNEPIKAYEILENLSSEKKIVKPPSVYRALAFLQEHNLIHRIERIDSYMTCCHLGQMHTCMYVFCDKCRKAIPVCEFPLDSWVNKVAKHHNFSVEAKVVELFGKCENCTK